MWKAIFAPRYLGEAAEVVKNHQIMKLCKKIQPDLFLITISFLYIMSNDQVVEEKEQNLYVLFSASNNIGMQKKKKSF